MIITKKTKLRYLRYKLTSILKELYPKAHYIQISNYEIKMKPKWYSLNKVILDIKQFSLETLLPMIIKELADNSIDFDNNKFIKQVLLVKDNNYDLIDLLYNQYNLIKIKKNIINFNNSNQTTISIQEIVNKKQNQFFIKKQSEIDTMIKEMKKDLKYLPEYLNVQIIQ